MLEIMIKRSLAFLGVMFALTAMWGCQSESPVVGGVNAAAAAIRVEESRQEYEDCRAGSGQGAGSCEALRDLYRKDQAEFDEQAAYR